MKIWTAVLDLPWQKGTFPSLALRRDIVVWSGTSLSRFSSLNYDHRNPSVCLDARPNTMLTVTAVSIA